jgi:hypothetical protein
MPYLNNKNKIKAIHHGKHEVCRQCKGKGKAIPLQALTDPEGSRMLRLPDFMTIGT